MGGGRWTKREIDLLIKLNKEGKNYVEIANILKTRTLNACRLKGLNIGLDGDNNADVDFFSRDDEEKHYVLGYWLADGCIMKKSGGYYFSIVSNDVEHLKNISNIMGIKTKIYKNSNNAFELRVGNKKLVQSLIKIGGAHRKTNTIRIQDLEFNKKHFNHLLRGYFDGDGSYVYQGYVRQDGIKNISSIRFTGSNQLIQSIYSYIDLKGSLSKDTRKGNCLYLIYHGDEMRELLEYMYSDCNVYLPRKYNIYKKHSSYF